MGRLSEGSRQALYKHLLDDTWPRLPNVLLVGSAIEELAVTLEEVASGRTPLQPGDRGSLAGDIGLASTRVGKHLTQATSPTLKDIRAGEVSKLADTFADRTECARVAALARDLLAQLDSAGAREAAWDDVIATLADDSKPVNACLLAFHQLNELLHSRGHDWGAVTHGLYDPMRAGDLDAVRELVSAPPPDNATVAWVVFTNAHLGKGMVRVGAIQFFSGWLAPKDLRDGCPAVNSPDFEPATELTEAAIEWIFLDQTEAEHVVYARVELAGERAKVPPMGRRLPPLEWARQLASDVVEAVGFRHGGTHWVLLDGGCYFTPRGGSFSRPSLPERRALASHPRYEPTGRALGDISPDFADALIAEDEKALAAMEAIRWHRAVQQTENPAMRVALHVRRFEVQWATGDPGGWRTWHDPLRHFLRDRWCRDQQYDALFWGGRLLLRGSLAGSPLDAARVAAQQVHKTTGAASFRIDLNAMMRLAPQVAGEFLGGSFERRYFKELARRTRSSAATLAWWRDLRASFDVLLSRSLRQRNRVIHGREPVPEVIRTVDGFITRLSAYLTASAVQAAAERRDVDPALADEREELADVFESLGDESSVSTLFCHRDGHAFYDLLP